nr:hypothetical protein [Tanacetum cinerariifolium]
KPLYKALVEAYESDKLILDTYGDIVTIKRRRNDQDKDKEPFAGSNGGPREEEQENNLNQQVQQGRILLEDPIHAEEDLEQPAHQEFDTVQPWINNLAQMEDPCELSNELLDTPLDLLAFLMNRLKVDTLTSELLAGPTFELMKGSCMSLVVLEYFLKEVYKATTNQLDWNNHEGQQYLHDLYKPLPLIPNSQVIKTKAADYRFAANMESARDVYSKRRIIVVTKLQIVEWHNYKHLDWITICRDDDKLYTFKEGDFNRICIQDIKDMLLFLVQGKLTNLTVEERLSFNVSLQMFTRSIVIQRRVKDLQLGVKSYQNKLNLTKPDTYRSNLKRREAYTAYSNPEVSFTITKRKRTD